MVWSYSGVPTPGTRDAVRFLLGDTDQSFQLMQDAEIDYVIALASTIYDDDFMAASICADVVANELAREISVNADGVSAGADELQDKFQKLAQNLRDMYDRIRGVGGAPEVFGVDAFRPPNFSVKPLVFGKSFTDNFRAGQQNFGNYGEMPEAFDLPLDGGYYTGWSG